MDGERLPLKDACEFALEEARTVVPGMQALLGFELIAAFNQRFDSSLGDIEKGVHLAAMLLGAMACALIMSPAAYHRQVGREWVSEKLLEIISRFVQAAMVAMMLSISLEIFVVSQLIFGVGALSVTLAGATLAVFAAAWLLYPALARRRVHRAAR